MNFWSKVSLRVAYLLTGLLIAGYSLYSLSGVMKYDAPYIPQKFAMLFLVPLIIGLGYLLFGLGILKINKISNVSLFLSLLIVASYFSVFLLVATSGSGLGAGLLWGLLVETIINYGTIILGVLVPASIIVSLYDRIKFHGSEDALGIGNSNQGASLVIIASIILGVGIIWGINIYNNHQYQKTLEEVNNDPTYFWQMVKGDGFQFKHEPYLSTISDPVGISFNCSEYDFSRECSESQVIQDKINSMQTDMRLGHPVSTIPALNFSPLSNEIDNTTFCAANFDDTTTNKLVTYRYQFYLTVKNNTCFIVRFINQYDNCEKYQTQVNQHNYDYCVSSNEKDVKSIENSIATFKFTKLTLWNFKMKILH